MSKQTDGAIDYEYDDHLQDAESTLRAELEGIQTEPMPGGVALDLVTRQPLFVRRVVADTLVEYYDNEGFDLASYKTHPYLPVTLDDTVYECVFVSGSAEGLHNPGSTYDFPRGRLAHIPVEQAWEDEDA